MCKFEEIIFYQQEYPSIEVIYKLQKKYKHSFIVTIQVLSPYLLTACGRSQALEWVLE
jgi:hypothetical protein